MDTIPMTVAGAKALEVELLRLKDEERPRIVNEIATAREHGDLKENAEYHAAKDEQGFIEGRIQEIESKLSRMQLIDVTQLNQDGRCVFGTTVTLLNLNDDSRISYQIVGEDEADIELGERLNNQGFEIVATRTNQEILQNAGLECTMVNKVSEGSPHIVDLVKNDEISLIISSTEDTQGLEDAAVIRCQALVHKVPCMTTVAAAFATLDGLKTHDKMIVRSLQSLH